MDKYKVCVATRSASLEEQIRSAMVPKNEREWWAKRHIDYLYEVLDERNGDVESLRAQLAECERERDDFERKWLDSLKVPDVVRLEEQLATVTKEWDELRQICRDAYEVWAGSEGIPEPVYASEAYLYQLLINMRDEVKRGLAKLGADKGEK